MKNLLICIITSVVVLSSCSVVQIYQVKPTTDAISQQGQYYVYENDTVKVTYSFWNDKGLLSYTFYNKLNIPIYIDWKKSCFIRNGEKLDYWKDEVKTTAVSHTQGTSYLFSGYYNLLSGTSSTSVINGNQIKPERVIFIAPKSSITNVRFHLNLNPASKLPAASATVINNPSDNKSVSAKQQDYSQDNTSVSFRNFITISTTENFEKEYYIDNSFYVSNIVQISTKDFDTDKQPFKNPQWFYIDNIK